MATNSLAYNKQFDLPQRSTDDEEYIKTLENQLKWYANELTRLDDEINFYRSRSEKLAELEKSGYWKPVTNPENTKTGFIYR